MANDNSLPVAEILENGTNHINDLFVLTKDIAVVLVKGFTVGEPYATITNVSRLIADTSDTASSGGSKMVTGDFVVSVSGLNSVITIAAHTAGKASANTGSLGTDDLAAVIVNHTDSTVIASTQSTSTEFTTGITEAVDFPEWTINLIPPVA